MLELQINRPDNNYLKVNLFKVPTNLTKTWNVSEIRLGYMHTLIFVLNTNKYDKPVLALFGISY